MSSQSLATEQLLELLLTLKKTTPAAAKSILNGQPPIAYALITLMVSMNAINIEVFQKTLAEYGTAASAPFTQGKVSQASNVPTPPSQTPQVSNIPPHLQAQYRTTTPPSNVPTAPAASTPYSYMNGTAAYPGNAGYAQQTSQSYGYPQQTGFTGNHNNYGAQPSTAPNPSSTVLPDALATIPDEQKALIMRVISMTPEQINMLPASERATFIQIRATLGIPTG